MRKIDGRMPLWTVAPILFLSMVRAPLCRADDEAESTLGEARAAARGQRWAEAVSLAAKVLAERPGEIEAYRIRAVAQSRLDRSREAIADCDAALRLDPNATWAFPLRGAERFKRADIDGSLADFDRQIAIDPAAERGHWMRGITLYYAGRYADGRRQFEAYQTVDDSDVENVVWRMLCQVRETDFATAQKDLWRVGRDLRVPMAEVYELFAGRATAEQVQAAANAATNDPDAGFFAELYLGLFEEAQGNAEQSLEWIRRAAARPLAAYMAHVARVHAHLRGGDKLERSQATQRGK